LCESKLILHQICSSLSSDLVEHHRNALLMSTFCTGTPLYRIMSELLTTTNSFLHKRLLGKDFTLCNAHSHYTDAHSDLLSRSFQEPVCYPSCKGVLLHGPNNLSTINERQIAILPNPATIPPLFDASGIMQCFQHTLLYK